MFSERGEALSLNKIINDPALIFMEMNIVLLLACAAGLYMFFSWRRKQKLACTVLDNVFSAMGYGIVYFDRMGKFKIANAHAYGTLPIDAVLAKGKSITHFLDYLYDHAIEGGESTKRVIGRALGGYQMQRISFREIIRAADGHLCLVMTQETPLSSTILVLVNIDAEFEREESFNLVSEENYQLYHAIESANIGVVISAARKSGNPVIFANSALSDITGMPRHDLIGSYWHVLLSVFADGVDLRGIEGAFDNGTSIETPLTLRSSGRNYWYSLTITPVLDALEQPEYFIGIFQDTTELKIREAEFYQAQKLEALGQLSAGVAHDFNNILSIVDGYAILAERRLRDSPETSADYLKRILVATQRGAALTKRMMTFGAHRAYEDSTHNLVQIIRDHEMLIHAVLDPALVSLELDYGHDEIYIKCAPDVFSQIIMNLVINARDAIGGHGGKITIRADIVDAGEIQSAHMFGQVTGGSYARFSVRDTGAGMDAALIGKIFNPFFTTKMDGKGCGLGLSVVYGLINDMGGAIGVESEPGAGTAISLYVPLSGPPENCALDGDVEETGSHNLSRLVAMVVDNEPDILKITSEMLRDFGMHVLSAGSGDEALLLQDDFDGVIDVLVSDILMPEMNGIKLAELFLSVRPHTRIVFVSGYASTSDRKALEIPGYAALIAKPLHPEKISAVLEAIFISSSVQPVVHKGDICREA